MKYNFGTHIKIFAVWLTYSGDCLKWFADNILLLKTAPRVPIDEIEKLKAESGKPRPDRPDDTTNPDESGLQSENGQELGSNSPYGDWGLQQRINQVTQQPFLDETAEGKDDDKPGPDG